MLKSIKSIDRTLISKLILFFFACSILGWIYEVVLEVFIYKWGFSNRGTFFGPYCIVYGFGCLILLFFLRSALHGEVWKAEGGSTGKKVVMRILQFIVVFTIIVIVTTIVELIASYISEALTGGFAWNYERFHPNFQGRIALNPSLRFGAGGSFIFYVIYPALRAIASRMREATINRAALIMSGIFIVDVVLTMLFK